MSKYRILTDGSLYYVEKRIDIIGLRFWAKEKYYEVNDTYPKIKAHLVEFDSQQEAEHYVEEQLEHDRDSSPWRVVRTF